MSRSSVGKVFVFLMVMSFFLMGVNECGYQDRKAVSDFLDEWADVQNKNPVNPDGSFNPTGFVNAVTEGPSSDEAGAALDPDKKLKDIRRADHLADEGLANRDLGKVDEAISLRPKDLGYHNTRGVILLIQGREAEAMGEFRKVYSPAGLSVSRKVYLAVLRDRMRTIDGQLITRGITDLRGKPEAIATLEKYYCEDAFQYWKATGDRSYGDKYSCGIPK